MSQNIWHILARTFYYIKKETDLNLVCQIVRARQINKMNNISKAAAVLVQILSYLLIVVVLL